MSEAYLNLGILLTAQDPPPPSRPYARPLSSPSPKSPRILVGIAQERSGGFPRRR